MTSRLPQPTAVTMSTDPQRAALDRKPVAVHPNADGEAISRRNIAALLGSATLGALAFAACSDGQSGDGQGGRPQGEPTGQLAQTLSGLAVSAADSIADLRAVNVTGMTQGTVVLVLGYYVDGDGGGGAFYWTTDTTTPPDLGTVILANTTPPNPPSRTGCWKRIITEPISVKWFGAKGDGTTDDTAAIQAALDFIPTNFAPIGNLQQWRGNDVVVPPGQYVLSAPSNGAALWIARNNVTLVGVGASPYGQRFIINGPGSGVASCGILIETGGSTTGQCYPPTGDGGGVPCSDPGAGLARAVHIRNITIYGNALQDAIVVHAAFVSIYDCYINTISRHGILIESGSTNPGGIYGVTKVPNGFQFNVDFWRLMNVSFAIIGNVSSGGDPLQGACVFVHGSDSNGGVAIALGAQGCNVGYHDGALSGALWLGCYSEAGNLSYSNSAAFPSTYINCGTEDTKAASFTGSGALTIGGAMTLMGSQGALQRVGAGVSQLQFGTIGPDGATYRANVPGNFNSAIDFSRTPPSVGDSGTAPASVWRLAWQPSGNIGYPYLQSWRWAHYTNEVSNPDIDVTNGPFGWTDIDNPRGAGLPLIANPLMNTTRRWTLRQVADGFFNGKPITLQPGPTVVYLFGTQVLSGNNTTNTWNDLGGAAFLSDLAPTVWPKAQTRVSVEIEFDPSTLASAVDIRVVGYAFVPHGANRNIAARIINAGTSAVTVVALVWHYEIFVPNYDPGVGLG
jgi:hypothetical protein